jgi:parvulin-like peptidyl-prolyl isomerase
MKRALLLAGALFLGIATGEWCTGNFGFRSALGRFVRRGELRQLVGSRGIYDRDPGQRGRSLEQLVAEARIDSAATGESVNRAALTRELDRLRASLPNEKAWDTLLVQAGTSPARWRREVAENLRGRAWLETRVGAAQPPNDNEIRGYFAVHQAEFQQPPRYRASHLFLAAPDGCPAEIFATKRRLIDELALRLQKGESFDALVAQFSEDEETKKRDGDLGYFDEERMLPELFAAAQSLRVGDTSTRIRSRLGFHLLRLTEVLPAREMTLPEATPEIAANLQNARRAAVLSRLR